MLNTFLGKNIQYEKASKFKNDEAVKKLEPLNIDDVDKIAISDQKSTNQKQNIVA